MSSAVKGSFGQHEPHGGPFGKMPGHGGDIFGPLAERGQTDGKYGDAIPEILAELPLGHHRGQVAMGGRHDPHIDVNRFVPSHALHPTVLKNSQQADLGGQGQLADLVQKQRSTVGPLEPSLPRLHRAGEGPAFMAEQLRVDQLRRDRSTVHAQERAVGPRRLGVEHARDDFLARSRLAENENGGIVAGNQGHTLHDVLKSRICPTTVSVSFFRPKRFSSDSLSASAAARMAAISRSRWSFSKATEKGSMRASTRQTCESSKAVPGCATKDDDAGRVLRIAQRTGHDVGRHSWRNDRR